MQIEVMIIGIQVEIVDKMPLIAKVIIIPGVIFLIWVILISFGFVSESVSIMAQLSRQKFDVFIMN